MWLKMKTNDFTQKHNEFVPRIIKSVGPELINQGNVNQQLVALESIIAGLFMLVMKMDNHETNGVHANVMLSALIHGVRGRLKE